jgi:hypothetical protein
MRAGPIQSADSVRARGDLRAPGNETGMAQEWSVTGAIDAKKRIHTH